MKVLIIQTAFIGDVILATSLIELLKKNGPANIQIDFFLRKGNESLLENNPHINKTYIWDKRKSKFKSLVELLLQVRKEKYDYVFNIQRFFNSGLVTALSGAKVKVGFDKNPLSFFFDHKIKHLIPHQINEVHLHEVQRNAQLVSPLLPKLDLTQIEKPKLYFNETDFDKISSLNLPKDYLVVAPSSVWFTKQWHAKKWIDFLTIASTRYPIFIIGAPSDSQYLEQFLLNANITLLSNQLSLRQSALLMKGARRVFVNDSAPLHLASSVNANTTAIFCSTTPRFGYFPVSDNSSVIETTEELSCKPCGLHGKKECPLSHFNCSNLIEVESLIETI